MADDRYCKLHYLSTVYRNSAQTLFLRRAQLHYLIVILSITAAIVTVFISSAVAWIFVVFSCLIQLATLIIKNVAINRHLQSRDLVKIRLLENSLGVKHDQIEYEELTADHKFLKKYSADQVNVTYYDSKEPIGPKRLAYNLAESIFYTKSIYRENRKRVVLKFAILCSAVLFVIIFSLAFFTTELKILFVVPITTVLAVIIFEEAEQFYRVIKDIKKYDAYDRTMDTLIRNSDFDLHKIMAVLGDYSSATKLSSPVPSSIYKKINKILNTNWDERCKSLQESVYASREKEQFYPQLFFENVAKEFFNNEIKLKEIIDIILKDANVVNVVEINISKVLGNSNNDVFSFVLQGKASTDSVTLFVKFYQNEQNYLKEKTVLRKYSKKSDYFAKNIICDVLEKYSCIVFYHVQTTSVSQFCSVSQIISDADIEKLGDKGKLTNITSALDAVHKVLNENNDGDSEAQNVGDYLNEQKPADLILDLGFFEYEIKGDNVIYLNSCISDDMAFAKNIPILHDTFDLEFINWSTEKNTVALTKIGGYTIAVILPRISYGKMKINFSRLPTKKCLFSLEDYLKIKGICEIDISLSETYASIVNSIKSLNPQMVLCHNDFHAENLFVSESSFKILDLSDVGYALKYADVCRMQASLLQHFLKTSKGTSIVSSFLLALRGEKVDNKTSEFIFQLKTNYDNTVKNGDEEYIYTLLMELILQCFYSICSNKRINEEWCKLLQGVVAITASYV